MSQVVTIKAIVAAPAILKEMIDKITAKDPSFAALIQEMDARELIAECVKSAVDAMVGGHPDIMHADAVLDYSGRVFSKKYHAIIKSRGFSRGLGISVDETTGAISFTTDNYGHQSEVARLRELFQQYFVQEALKAVLEVLGYQIEMAREVVKDSKTGAEKIALALCAQKEN